VDYYTRAVLGLARRVSYGTTYDYYIFNLKVFRVVITGANPTIASYNASVVEVYSAVNSMARF
jgi:hypothetical protein